jgi:hypothetical protein
MALTMMDPWVFSVMLVITRHQFHQLLLLHHRQHMHIHAPNTIMQTIMHRPRQRTKPHPRLFLLDIAQLMMRIMMTAMMMMVNRL